jgi:AP-1 complex subunit mu
MVASAIFFMDSKGKILISRNYRGDVSKSQAEKFAIHMQETDPLEQKPVSCALQRPTAAGRD